MCDWIQKSTEIIAWIGMKVSTLVIFIVLSLETYSFHNWNYAGISIFQPIIVTLVPIFINFLFIYLLSWLVKFITYTSSFNIMGLKEKKYIHMWFLPHFRSK